MKITKHFNTDLVLVKYEEKKSCSEQKSCKNDSSQQTYH